MNELAYCTVCTVLYSVQSTIYLEEELVGHVQLVVVAGHQGLDAVPVLGVHPQERATPAP